MSAAAERKRRAILFRGCLEAGGLRGRGGHLSSRVGLIKMASEMDLCALNQSLLVDMFEDSFNGSNPNNTTTIQEFLVNVKDMCDHVLLHKWISIIVPIIFAVIVLVGIGGNILVLLVVILKQQMRNTTNVLMLVSIRIFAQKLKIPENFEFRGRIFF